MEIELTQIQEKEYDTNINQLRQDIYKLLLQKEKDHATEILTTQLKRKYCFYTTRFDEQNEIYYYNEGVYKPEGRTIIKEYCRNILQEAYTTPLASRVEAKIEADTFIEQEKFLIRHYHDKIACLNGIINLKTFELEPFSPKMIFFTKVNAKFDPTKKCEKIDYFLTSILPEIEDTKTIYEVFGYCLHGGYSIQKMVLLIGEGENGKGQLLELLRQFLGEGNYCGIPLQKLEGGDFKEYELFRKLANIGADISDSPLKTTAKLKGLSGGDSINASRKFKNDLTFINEAKLIFSANKLPKTYDLSHAFFRRWVYLQFPFKFVTEKELKSNTKEDNLKIKVPEIVKGLLTENELSGLLNQALIGLSRLFVNKDFTASKSNKETRNWWVRNSDSFLAFCDEILEPTETELEWITKDVLRKHYQKYCRTHRLMPEGDKHIHEIMVRDVGAWESQLSDESRERVWKGIKFKSKGDVV
ncbi:MAG: phage/plasmid primase, P4 family [archaeon]